MLALAPPEAPRAGTHVSDVSACSLETVFLSLGFFKHHFCCVSSSPSLLSLKLGDLKVTSPVFGPSGHLDKRYGGDGENKSPPLVWTGAPSGTKEFALICHDPDAPLPDGFTHWVMYGIPAGVTKLAEGQKAEAFTPGVNGTQKTGYMDHTRQTAMGRTTTTSGSMPLGRI